MATIAFPFIYSWQLSRSRLYVATIAFPFIYGMIAGVCFGNYCVPVRPIFPPSLITSDGSCRDLFLATIAFPFIPIFFPIPYYFGQGLLLG